MVTLLPPKLCTATLWAVFSPDTAMPPACFEVLLGNANRRFSGVTSTLLQTLPHQQPLIPLAVLGAHHLPNPQLSLSFWQAIKACRTPLDNGRWRVFHARRNMEMVQALLLKHLFRAKIRILFTSTAQRHHSRFTRFLLKRMDAVISTCQAAAQYLQVPCRAIIPHGIECQSYRPPLCRATAWQALGLPGQIGIGIFGRVRPQKGVHHLVNACIALFPQFPQYSLIIVGAIAPADQAYVKALQTQVAQAGLSDRIHFLGEQPFTRLPELFQAVSLVAALSQKEGFGLTVLEAMASGAAVLATEAGAWPDIIENGQEGYCVPCEDYNAIKAQLNHLLAQPQQLATLGKKGRNKVLQHYQIQQEAAALCQVYRQLQAP